MLDGNDGCRNCAGHGDDKQNEVRPQNRAESAGCREDNGNRTGDNSGYPVWNAERNAENLEDSQRNVSHNENVDQHAQIDGSKSADERGACSAVTLFVEFQVGHDAQAPPQSSVDKYCRQTGGKERPPAPVSADALFTNELRYQVGRVGGKRRRDQRKAQKPPRH